MTFHKIKAVHPLDDYVLQVEFLDGVHKTYDVKSLFAEHELFLPLSNIPGLFDLVHVDFAGYAVCWNESIDISSEELWQHGKDITYGRDDDSSSIASEQ